MDFKLIALVFGTACAVAGTVLGVSAFKADTPRKERRLLQATFLLAQAAFLAAGLR